MAIFQGNLAKAATVHFSLSLLAEGSCKGGWGAGLFCGCPPRGRCWGDICPGPPSFLVAM